jgi:hypothetical protein
MMSFGIAREIGEPIHSLRREPEKMARKPNYDFERRERERAKAAKTAERAKAKTDSKTPPPEKAEDAKEPTDQ